MLIFTCLQNIKELLVAYRPADYHFYEFNLSSPINQGVPLPAILPNPEVIPSNLIETGLDSVDFDSYYVSYLFNDRDAFLNLIQIMNPLYQDPEACVIVYIGISPVRATILEALLKVIQQRYQYAPYMVIEPQDCAVIQDNFSFGVHGIVNIQDDTQQALMMGFYGAIPDPREVM